MIQSVCAARPTAGCPALRSSAVETEAFSSVYQLAPVLLKVSKNKPIITLVTRQRPESSFASLSLFASVCFCFLLCASQVLFKFCRDWRKMTRFRSWCLLSWISCPIKKKKTRRMSKTAGKKQIFFKYSDKFYFEHSTGNDSLYILYSIYADKICDPPSY